MYHVEGILIIGVEEGRVFFHSIFSFLFFSHTGMMKYEYEYCCTTYGLGVKCLGRRADLLVLYDFTLPYFTLHINNGILT